MFGTKMQDENEVKTVSKLSEAARRAKNEYARKWAATHKESRKESNRKYWEKRAAKLAAEREKQKKEGEDLDDG